MLRFHRLCIALVVGMVFWLVTCARVDTNSSPVLSTVVFALPVLAVLAYGLAAFLMLVYGVSTFRSVPEEATALRAEIVEAQTFLRKQGVSVS